jgi:hypothetical protein
LDKKYEMRKSSSGLSPEQAQMKFRTAPKMDLLFLGGSSGIDDIGCGVFEPT